MQPIPARKISTLICLLVLSGLAASSVAANPDVPSWLDRFGDPPAWARPQMFFVWNGDADKERIGEMLRQYADEGLGGVFVHPRPGLITEYLSPEWFEAWRYTLDECRRLGLECHIYDENGFPSGFASGEVLAADPTLAAHYLTPVKVTNSAKRPEGEIIACFTVPDGNDLPRRATEETLAEAGDARPVWALVVRSVDARSAHGGHPYPDVLRPETAEIFLRVTHDRYARHFQKHFGREVKYMFTDEPDMPGAKGLPWSDYLLTEFRREHGYDLRDNLTPLCFGGPESTAVRFDYWKTIGRLWIDNFVRPIYEWCDRHDLAFTGHLWEHEWPVPQKQPLVMHTYRWMQAPGTDLLGFHFFPTSFEDQLLAYLNQKELSSIANQLGRPHILCESSGAGGYGMALREFKPLEDFLLASGISVMTPHLSYQTLAGARKYDWPQTISDHASWWDSYDLQTNHVGRVVYALAQGREHNRILVLHPDTSGWVHYQHEDFLLGREAESKLAAIKKSQCEFLGKLHGGQIDFDLGDELTMAELGGVEGGRMQIGEAVYDAVAIPPAMDNWTAETLARIGDYLRAGGKLYTCAEPPTCVDGRASTEPAELAQQFPKQWKRLSSAEELVDSLRETHRPRISRPDGSALPIGLCHRRHVRPDGSIVYFFCYPWNEPFGAEVRLEGSSLLSLDTVDGTAKPVPTRPVDGGQVVTLDLPALGHALFVANPEPAPTTPVEESHDWQTVELAMQEIERNTKNVLALMFCELEAGDTKAEGVNTTVADDLNWKAHGCSGNIWSRSAQFRRTLIDKQFPSDSGFTVSYRFAIEPDAFEAVRDSLEVAIERPWLYQVTLNGKALDFASDTRWLDPEIRKASVTELARPGENVLQLKTKPMRPLCEIMPVYVLGDFALTPQDKGFSIAKPQDLELGSWADQGLPFYPGKVTYRYAFTLDESTNDSTISLPDWSGSAARVRVDGQDAGVIAWPPDRLEVDRPLGRGDHTLEVVVAGNMKNLMGPHFSDGLPGIWSWIWSGRQAQPAEKYKIVPCGLMEPPQLEAVESVSMMRKATQADWPIRWYIPPEEGPVVGNQNGWFLTPHDILPGDFTFSGKVENATTDSFEMTPNSVWGNYRFRITRTGPPDEPTPDLQLRKVVPVRAIHFADLTMLTDEQTLLFSGTLREISSDRKTFIADMGFKDGPVTCRLDLIEAEEKKIPPAIRSMHYGPHWQHTMDLYYPEDRGSDPLPVILYIHGGGWGALDKEGVNKDVPKWTGLGFAVVSFNYRFVSNAQEYPAMSPPVAAPLYDAARALQYLRYRSEDLGLDTSRIAVTGGSAGGATTCWLAMHDDMADPDSPDPVARQSTRVTCAFPVQAQTSLDPRQMREWIPQITYGAHAFFTRQDYGRKEESFEYFLAHRDEVLPWIREFSAYEWASADDPPMLLVYGGQKDVIPALDKGNATHHPKFGEHLHERLTELGVESYYWADNVRCEKDRYHGWPGITRFVCDKLLGSNRESRSQR